RIRVVAEFVNHQDVRAQAAEVRDGLGYLAVQFRLIVSAAGGGEGRAEEEVVHVGAGNADPSTDRAHSGGWRGVRSKRALGRIGRQQTIGAVALVENAFQLAVRIRISDGVADAQVLNGRDGAQAAIRERTGEGILHFAGVVNLDDAAVIHALLRVG